MPLLMCEHRPLEVDMHWPLNYGHI